MKEGSSAPGADYNEMKEEINEQLEEIDEIEQDIEQMKESFDTSDQNKKHLISSINKAKSTDDLQKIKRDLTEMRDNINNIYNDAQDAREQLDKL